MKSTNNNKLLSLVSGLNDLYAEFKSAGEVKADDFLVVRKLGTLQEYLKGQVIHFNAEEKLHGVFVVVSLSCRRPSSRQLCRMFIHDKKQGIIQEEDDPVNFMGSLTVNVEKGSTEMMRSDLTIFEKSIISWVKREIEDIQKRGEADFMEERERLSVFYSKQFEELKNKKKSVFFHNYFFEKEARIKEDIKQNHAEMKEQESLLNLRYQPQFQIDVLLCGSLS